ncbi:MAG: HAMP domain-containing protein [Rhodospirillales bacterium]|nr:HAMP domain-containing protein [Rhodospirillales bacterium]
MLAGWSLRTRLVVVVTVALLPVLALSAWYAVREQRATELRRVETVAAAAELVVARHRELLEATRRLLVAMCEEDTVRQSASPDAGAADINRCEAYLGQVLQKFPNEYSSAFVTDAAGTARCSSAPTAVGMGFSDREIFRLVRETGKFAVGVQLASRVTPTAVIPTALPILKDGEFRGMCALGISLRWFADLVTPASAADPIAVSLIDRRGVSLAGSAEAERVLPVAVRLAAAIVGGQKAFREYGQDGQLYEFRLLPLADASIFVVAAATVAEGFPSLLGDWGGFILVVLALAAALLAVWLGADRWCVRPLRYIRDFADRVARGDDMKFEPKRPWGPELQSVGEGVRAMAAAIASREAELRAGLEQRDHMLREIHHRVKNNLQMISSLLNLQAGEIRSPRIRRFFGDAQNRVLTLSILHRHLYERSSWALVDFQQFISDLVRQISVGRRRPDRPQPRYQIRAPIMAVGPDIAIPIGLIVTEAVSSALSRNFDNVTAPEIRIEAADKAGTVELTIEDNGAGGGGSLGSDARGGFGLTLIRGLAMQLGGEAQISPREGGGMRVAVIFPMPQDEEADA